MNIFNIFREKLNCILEVMCRSGTLPRCYNRSLITVEVTRDATHGDLSTIAAMVLAKDAAMNPKELAGLIADKLSLSALVCSANVAGPGFINVKLCNEIWVECL